MPGGLCATGLEGEGGEWRGWGEEAAEALALASRGRGVEEGKGAVVSEPPLTPRSLFENCFCCCCFSLRVNAWS